MTPQEKAKMPNTVESAAKNPAEPRQPERPRPLRELSDNPCPPDDLSVGDILGAGVLVYLKVELPNAKEVHKTLSAIT